MDVIEIIMDMFETERTNMLVFRTDLDPLRRLLPNIFREGLDWRRWCNGLSEEEVSRVRTNRDTFKYYAQVTSERLVARGIPYDNRWKSYGPLVMLLARLDGFIPANYEVGLPGGL